jgi:glycosyltransferase involved in cell wall biosynthesis
MPVANVPDLVCFSHLRWGFVFQRPQQIMARLAAGRRVFFFEEPVLDDDGPERLHVEDTPQGVTVMTPHLASGRARDPEALARAQRLMLDDALARDGITDFVAWYYTPMALAFSDHLQPRLVVHDCMDELANFAGAPADLKEREAELLRRAGLVFTGGRSLYEARRERHPSVHLFPSSVDTQHFAGARRPQPDPSDQYAIPRPRLGFAGVIDERMDLALLAGVAALRPEWHLVLLGPVVKISPSSVPAAANIHLLGMKPYPELPAYLAGWDVGILPFARNEATRFISPTKTPEYLAAGLPVVSTSIRDVVRTYGVRGLARIADSPHGFVGAVESALQADRARHRAEADAFLGRMSWDATVERMLELMDREVARCSITSSSAQALPEAS